MNGYHRFLRTAASLVIKPYHTTQNIGDLPRPTVFLVRHSDLKGPIDAFISLKSIPMRLWVLDVFFHFSDCFHQFRDYTFSARHGKRPLRFSLKAAAAAAVVAPLIRNIDSIPVYRGKRDILHTFQETNEVLKNGESIIIAVDIDYVNTKDPIKEIYTGFFHLEKAYFRDTGLHLAFMPIRFDAKNRMMTFSDPLYFTGKRSFYAEKKELVTTIIDFLNQS
jgi:hypothetical protein